MFYRLYIWGPEVTLLLVMSIKNMKTPIGSKGHNPDWSKGIEWKFTYIMVFFMKEWQGWQEWPDDERDIAAAFYTLHRDLNEQTMKTPLFPKETTLVVWNRRY